MVENNAVRVAPKDRLVGRDAKVEKWKNASEELVKYPAGMVTDSAGNILYEYKKGARLLILGQEVMDDCQTPWAEATVDQAFEALGNKKDVSVLERGFGMGIIATRTIQHLDLTGGSYACIELNKAVADYAKGKWFDKQTKISKTRATSPLGGRDKGSSVLTTFEMIEGDAVKETAKLASEGRKFDIIFSDTFPLTEEEKSVNDLLDIETVVKCLNPDGVFAFFGYYAGYQGELNQQQRSLVERNFDRVTRTIVKGINPPPDYKYFNPQSGPVRELPVIICTKPRIPVEA